MSQLSRRPSSCAACPRDIPVDNLDDLACQAATDSLLFSNHMEYSLGTEFNLHMHAYIFFFVFLLPQVGE